MRRTNVWQRLRESTEGPLVTVQIPREWAEELMRSLMTSLEIEDMGDEPDMEGEPHMEPDEDDLPGGMPDGDEDDGDELDFSGEDDDEPELAAGDDDDEDDSDDDDDDEDETDEGVEADMDGGRPATALGESAFARAGRITEKHVGFKKLKGELSHQKGVRNPGALAAAIGRKKYGSKGMAAKSAAGRRK